MLNGQYATSAIGTVIKRISAKGYIERIRKGRHYVLVPRLDQQSYHSIIERQELNKLINKMEGSISAFFGKESLSQEQYNELKLLIESIKQEQ